MIHLLSGGNSGSLVLCQKSAYHQKELWLNLMEIQFVPADFTLAREHSLDSWNGWYLTNKQILENYINHWRHRDLKIAARPLV